MIQFFPGVENKIFQGWLSHSQELSEERAAALASLLDQPKYKDGAGNVLPSQDIFAILNNVQTVPNPVPQRMDIPIVSLPRAAFDHSVGSRLLAAILNLPADNPSKSHLLTSFQLFSQTAAERVVFSSPLVQSLLQNVILAGAMTEREVSDLTCEPDPAWKPTVQILSDAQGLGPRVGIVEIFEIKAAMAGLAG